MLGARQPAAAGAALDDEPEPLDPELLDPEPEELLSTLEPLEPEEPDEPDSPPELFFSPPPAAARLSVR